MRYSPPPEEQPAALDVQHAAILVDYQNLHARLGRYLPGGAKPSSYITDVLNELKRYLHDADATQTSLTYAYADFSALQGETRAVEQALYLQNVEPRFVPATLQDNASEVQLCVDAIGLVHQRPDVRTFVLVTGSRPYLPLVQALRRHGCHAFVVALETPSALEESDGDVFLNLRNLLGEAARADLNGNPPPAAPARETGGGPDGSASAAPASAASASAGGPDPDSYRRLDDPAAVRTLAIAEEHFGQYEEIYLTPLLRKLSEVLGSQYDPKSLVSKLEDARAVRLEKRQGYPYDYTVLIMHYDHPDVEEARRDTNYHPAPSSYAGSEEDRYNGDARHATSDDGYGDSPDDHARPDAEDAAEDDAASPTLESDEDDAEAEDGAGNEAWEEETH